VAEGRIDKTVPFIFSADETADVGVDDTSTVVEEYGEGRKTWFTGRINRVTVEVK
jgi:arylsulfatase